MLWPLFIYNAVNVYTDVRWRKTKNVWHLIYLTMAFICLFLWRANLPSFWSIEMLQLIFVSFILWLFVGLFLEVFRMYYPGDTKMTVVNAFWLSLAMFVSGGWEKMTPTLIFFAFALASSFLLMHMVLLLRHFGWKRVWWSIRYIQSLTKSNGSHISIPGAVPIACAVMLTIIKVSF